MKGTYLHDEDVPEGFLWVHPDESVIFLSGVCLSVLMVNSITCICQVLWGILLSNLL